MRKGITDLMQITSDQEWKEELEKIDDPIDMLLAIVHYNDSYGWDSYYRDLKDSLFSQIIRILDENGAI